MASQERIPEDGRSTELDGLVTAVKNRFERLCEEADLGAAADELRAAFDALSAAADQAENQLRTLRKTSNELDAAYTESEERYEQLLGSLTDYVYEVSVAAAEPVVTTHSPGCLAVTGFTAEEYAADPQLWYRMVHEEDRAAVKAQAASILAGGPVHALEHRIIHKDGSLRWLRNRPIPHCDRKGQRVGYESLVTDITKRRLAETALKESEERYRTLFSVASDAIFLETLEGQILDCNQKACEMYGYSRDELLTLTVADLVPEEVRAQLPNLIDAQLERGGIFVESRNLTKDGRTLPVEVSTRTINLGGELRVIVYVRDITERKDAEAARLRQHQAEARAAAAEAAKTELEKAAAQRERAEAALRESENKFRTLAEQSPNMILINRGGRVVYANEACERILGYSKREMASSTFDRLSLFAPEFLDSSQKNYEAHLRGEELPPCEYTLVGRDGRRLEVIFTTKLIDYEGDHAILAIVTDITQRKQEEQRLHELQRTIIDLPAKEQRRIGQELHDNLGQQLTGVGMLTKALCRKLSGRGATEAENAEQIYALIQEAHGQLRALARGLVPVEVDAEGLMSALEELATLQSRLSGIDCRFEYSSPVTVEDNKVATQLFRIAQEALTNALQHARPEVVVITLEATGNHTTLAVQDNGEGFTEPLEQRAGMGLQIMGYRAAAIDAELSISSDQTSGTVVKCTLKQGV